MTRGPEVFWTSSKSKWLRDKVNPIAEWKQYCWPFTVDQAWPEAPAQFRREFQFLWRSRFDCRPTNPLTGTRSDSPAPHETSFFTDWKLMDFRASGQMTRQDAYQVIRFDNFSQNYRLFAIPKTILTKASADEMGKWVASELKKGSSLYGGLLKGKLLNESEMLGTANDWTDWLVHQSGLPTKSAKTTYMYRRYRYMDSLVALIFPQFDIAKLFAPPVHRAHGKKYVRK